MADWYFRNSQGAIANCPGCGKIVRASDEYCPYCARRLRPAGRAAKMLQAIRQKLSAFALPSMAEQFFATRALTALIAFVFLLQIAAEYFLPEVYRLAPDRSLGIFSFLGSDPATYIRMGANFPLLTWNHGELWRLLTYCFLHGGIIHILFNCYALRDLGRLTEMFWNGKAMLAVFVLSGIGGGVASMLFTQGLSLGASGAICGLLGVLLGAYYKNKWQIGPRLGSELVRWAVTLLAFGLVAGADNGAHIGGMLVGAVMGYFLPPVRCTRFPARDKKIWDALFYASLLMLAACSVCAVMFFLRGPQYLFTL